MRARASFTLIEPCPSVVPPPAGRRRVLGDRRSFTLIELLIVIAVVAILSVVVILVLNPAELLKQARDSNRLQDLANINTALNFFQADTGGTVSMGLASTTYVSIPDPAATSTSGDQCQGLGLPTLPTGWSYHCAASSTYRLVNGTGWLPVDFTQISFKSPLALLPVDPVNATSSGSYYTYTPGGSWELTAIPESQKQRAKYQTNPSIPNVPGIITQGSNLSLSPLFNTSGLVGYWTFDEGSGTTANDSSGNGNNGTLTNGPTWMIGRIGGSLDFDGVNDFTKITSPTGGILNPLDNITLSAWAYWKGTGAGNPYVISKGWGDVYELALYNGRPRLEIVHDYTINDQREVLANTAINQNQWYLIVGTYDKQQLKIYINGVLENSANYSQTMKQSGLAVKIGSNFQGGEDANQGYWQLFKGQIDDVRIYSRALSAAEIAALYNATR